jgi:hypothetical protein
LIHNFANLVCREIQNIYFENISHNINIKVFGGLKIQVRKNEASLPRIVTQAHQPTYWAINQDQ